jgi:hypothetical protein
LSVLSLAAAAGGLAVLLGVVGADGGASRPTLGNAVWLKLPPAPALYEEPAVAPAAPVPDYSPPARLAAPEWPQAPATGVPTSPVLDFSPPARLAALEWPQAPATGVTISPVPAWMRHAVQVPAATGRPMIAVVIDDLGLDRERSARAIRLPGPLTMAFLAYAEALESQTAAARANGHELMLHVPMEPEGNFVDPGPQVLRTTQEHLELRRRLQWDLARFDGYVGINNHMGSKFTGDRDAMLVVLREVKSRGLLFLDSRTTAASVAARLAAEIGVPHVSRDVFIDHVPTGPEIQGKLAALEQLARERGSAVGIGHPYDVTLEALESWLPELRRRGFLLVPVSAVVRQRTQMASHGDQDPAATPRPDGG